MKPVKRVVFVGGVHGVGKTTFCQQLSNIASCLHYSASYLIRSEREDAIAVGSKNVQDINDNQGLLLRALSKLDADALLLDGHFSVLNSSGKPEEIPLDVFRAISPRALVMLTETPQIIAQRAQARDGRLYDPLKIETHQKFEESYALVLSDQLGVPLITGVSSERMVKKALEALTY